MVVGECAISFASIMLMEVLYVENRVIILTSQKDESVFAESHVNFTIEIGYHGYLTYTWQLNNQNISDEKESVDGQKWLSYNISSASIANAGRYCIVLSPHASRIGSNKTCFTLQVISTFSHPKVIAHLLYNVN